MTWVYMGIAVGILALLVEMGVAYRREASDLRGQQAEVRDRTQRLAGREEEARAKAAAASARAETLKAEKQHLANELAAQKQWCLEMETDERTRNPTRFLFKADTDGSVQ